jgi:hypothetical protein
VTDLICKAQMKAWDKGSEETMRDHTKEGSGGY